VTGLPLEKVVVHNHLLGRWVWPAAGNRRRHPRRADRDTYAEPGEGRGGHAKKTSSTIYMSAVLL